MQVRSGRIRGCQEMAGSMDGLDPPLAPNSLALLKKVVIRVRRGLLKRQSYTAVGLRQYRQEFTSINIVKGVISSQ